MLQKVDLILERMKIQTEWVDIKRCQFSLIFQMQRYAAEPASYSLNCIKVQISFITLPPAFPAKGRGTLQPTIQKMQLSYIHATTFFNHCNNFFNSFIYGQRFSKQGFQKTLCSFMRCVVCKGLKPQCYIYSENNCLTIYRTQYTNS